MSDGLMTFDVLEDAYNEDLIENGAWMQFTGPDGEPMFLDPDKKTMPCRAKVRSLLSVAYERHMDSLMEGTANRARRLKGDQAKQKLLREEMKRQQPQAFASLVTEFDNVSKAQPGSIKPGTKDLLHFALKPKSKDWVEQVTTFAANNENYGGEASKPVQEGNGDADAA